MRADLDRPTRHEIVEQLVEILFGQVFVIIVVDLHHRRIAAGAEAFHLKPGKQAIRRDVALRADAGLEHFLDRIRAAQNAGRRAAELDEIFADRGEIEHRVEGRDLKHADRCHAELRRDILDCRLRQPAVILLLRDPKQGDHSRRLASRRIFGELPPAARLILRRECEAVRLYFGEAAHAHRSTSPKTISSEPRMALTSASIVLRQRKSIA